MQFDEVLRTFSEFFEREGIRYDLPTTAADIEALERARRHPQLATDAYLKWLSLMMTGAHSSPRLNTDDDAPFEL
jgi:hypothetical protein